jgi:hypothetical protein
MDFTNETLESLGREAKARIEQGDKATDRAEQMYISAGLYLKEAKARIKHRKDITWEQWVTAHCHVGRSRADTYIQIADGTKTLAQIREENAEANRSYRHSPSRDGGSSEKPKRKQSRTSVDEARETATTHHDAMLTRVIAMVKKLEPNQLEALETKLKEII